MLQFCVVDRQISMSTHIDNKRFCILIKAAHGTGKTENTILAAGEAREAIFYIAPDSEK